MRRPAALPSFLLAAALLIALPAEAQHQKHHGQEEQTGEMARSDTVPGTMQGRMGQPMMGQGMMQMMHGMHRQMHQRMMQNPMHRSAMTAFLLPALADTLGLSGEQTSQIETLKSELVSHLRASREQMATRRQELKSLFEDEGRPAPDQVRQHLEEMASMRADRQARLFEAAERMREVLTEEQQERLEVLSTHDQMHLMMSNMPMMDMMQMMQATPGGQMGGGMMQGGMGPGMMEMHPDTLRQQMPRHQHRNNR